jgi:hypothetical protein
MFKKKSKLKYSIGCVLLSAALFTVSIVNYAVTASAQDNRLVIEAVASQQNVEVGDEFYVDFKVTENPLGLNNITALVSFDADKAEALSCGDNDEPNDRLKYNKNGNTAIMFPYNFANSRLNVVPKTGDSDYSGKADGVKTAAQLGIIKYANFLNKSTDGYLDNYEGTGTLIRLKLKAVANGSCNFSVNVSGAQSYSKGVPTDLTVESKGTTVTIGSGALVAIPDTYSPTIDESDTPVVTDSATPVTTDNGTHANSSAATKNSSSSAVADSSKTISFSDVESDFWGAVYINELAAKGIVNGYSDGSFAPNKVVKRADFIIMLLKGLNIDISKTPESNFTDVENGAYYYNAVGTAKSIGLANGNGDGTFSPDSNVTRQDMMLLAERAIEYKTKSTISVKDESVLNAFSDREDISPYAESALAAMVENGYISGSDGKLLPKSSTTRVQAAAVIAKIIKN